MIDKDSLTIKLLRAVGSPFTQVSEVPKEYGEALELYRYAIENKISLPYLESLSRRGKLNGLERRYKEERDRYLMFLNCISKTSKVLSNVKIRHVIFKTIKPFATVPGDIDVLIVLDDDNMYKKAVKVLLREGYKPELHDIIDVKTLTNDEAYCKAAEALTRPTYGRGGHISPTGTKLVDTKHGFDVDLSKEVAMSYVVYMDKNKFKKYVTKTKLPTGETIPVLELDRDLAIVIMHSVVKEQLYLLSEYYHFIYRLSEMKEKEINKFISILKENKITYAAKTFITITATLHYAAHRTVPSPLQFMLDNIGFQMSEATNLVKNRFKMPHRYDVLSITKSLLEKMREKTFVKTLAVQVLRMLNPRLTKLIINEIFERRSRETYL